jgi:hypothetical protein
LADVTGDISCPALQITKHAKLEKKEVDDVLGGEEAWKNVQKTDGRLRSCCEVRIMAVQRAYAAAGMKSLLLMLMSSSSLCHAASAIATELCRISREAWKLHVDGNGHFLKLLKFADLSVLVLMLLSAVTCPNCSAGQAYFMEVQIRSADEPATIFYKCVECAHMWREG